MNVSTKRGSEKKLFRLTCVPRRARLVRGICKTVIEKRTKLPGGGTQEFMCLPCKRLNCFSSRWANQKSYKLNSAFPQSSWRPRRSCWQRSIDWSRQCQRTSAWRARIAWDSPVAGGATRSPLISAAPSTTAGRSSASRSRALDTFAAACRWGSPGCASACIRPRTVRRAAPGPGSHRAMARRRCKVLSWRTKLKWKLDSWFRANEFPRFVQQWARWTA